MPKEETVIELSEVKGSEENKKISEKINKDAVLGVSC